MTSKQKQPSAFGGICFAFFETSVDIRLPLAASVEICISFDIRNSQMTFPATIDLRVI